MRILTGGVAFFDSGIGGITVLDSAKRALPNELFYYYGDNEHAPYGNLTDEQIMSFVKASMERLQTLHIKAVVLACNTATAVCVEKLRKTYPFPIIGAEPAILPACALGGDILILSTRATYQSERFCSLITRAQTRYPNARITAKPCDLLAGAIERNLGKAHFDFAKYLPTADKAYRAVVLGCTHYIYIKKQISEYYHCETVDGNDGIVRRLQNLLKTDCDKSRDTQPLVTPPVRLGENRVDMDGDIYNPAHSQIGKNAPIYFIGSQKQHNRLIYEQMFANPCK